MASHATRRSREAPPLDSVWDRSPTDADWAFVDLEMTGLDPAVHRVIQVCVERVRNGEVVERLLTFVDPGADPLGGQEIHGIGPDDVRGAPAFADLADRIVAALDGAVFVAHGARWDIAFLKSELARAGKSWSCTHYVDTLSLARQVLNVPRHALAALAEHFGIANPSPHRADNDVQVTRALFRHLLAELQPSSPRALWDVAVAGRWVRPVVLERAAFALEHQRDARVCYRPCGKAPRVLSFRVTEVRTDLDPPVVLGYLLDTRGRRELRADRIVSFELSGDAD
jgi:DNA polymerase III subunit epsilon